MPPPTEPEDFFSSHVAKAQRFYLGNKNSENTPLCVVSAGRERCAPGYQIERDTFPHWSIEFVAQGSGSVTLGPKTYPLSGGMLFCYGPGIPLRIAMHPAQPFVKYFVDFSGTRAESLLAEHGPEPGGLLRTAAPSAILAIFDDLIRNGLLNTRFTDRITALLLEHLVYKIAETSLSPEAGGAAAFATFFRCRQHIEEHYLRISSLSEAARQCHLDPAYLCRLFRRFDHQTPYHLLQRLKMNYAASRIQDPSVSVKLVADELGFSDRFHFSRVFKAMIGIPPSSFARLHRDPTSPSSAGR